MNLSNELLELLSTPAGEVKPPPTLPAGPYYGLVSDFEFGQSNTKQTPLVRFSIDITGPAPGNDADLSEIDFPRTMRWDFYLTKSTLSRLTQFQVDVLGLPANNTVMENIPLCRGRRAVFNVTLRNGNDGRVYSEIKSAAPI